jgi:PAS domain S-box-containing protein
MTGKNAHNGKFILIVEDDPGTGELETQRLEALGIEIRRAASAEETVALLKAATPALMLLDYSLPGGNAIELVKKLRASSITVPPFLMVTGRGDETVAVETMKSGASDYIIKNADFLDNLLPAARKALEKAALKTELAEAQSSIAKNLRLYTVLAQVNMAVAREKDLRVLLQKVCDIIVATGGFKMAWVGFPDRDTGRVLPFCSAGLVDGYLDKLKIELDEKSAYAKGPTGNAARTGKISICADIASDPAMEPWREKALAKNYRSSASVPLEESGRTTAVLTIYSEHPGFFGEDELKLLGEIKSDISLAFDAISSEKMRLSAQAALELTASQLTHVMETNPVILFRLRAVNGRMVTEWVSGNIQSMLGYEEAEILAPAWIEENLHPADKERVMMQTTEAFAKEGSVRDFRLRKKNNGYIWMHEQLRAISKTEFIGSWTDINRLKESEERFRTLVDCAPYGVLVRKGLEVIFANKSGVTIVKARTEEELVGKNILERLPGAFSDAVRQRLADIDEKGVSTEPLEIQYHAMDGTLIDLEISGSPIVLGGEKCGLIFFRDISERKKNERMLNEMSAMQRVESLGQLAGGIAHDFNNMLTGIMANISLLQARCGENRENAEILRETLDAARNAQSLTASLLSFSKGGKPVKKEFCMQKALQDIFGLATRGTKAACENVVKENLWSVEGDENQLKQAINNLLINSLQAMPAGGTLRLEAENIGKGATLPELLPVGDYLKLTVSDTGIGIPKEYLAKIFEPYFTTKSCGHGLGLSMTWSVIKNHGGQIRASSVSGEGTTFVIYLPATGRCLSISAGNRPEIPKGSGRVLVLEDEEVVAKAVARMLKELGYTAEITADGNETVRRYAEEGKKGKPFDLVLMDLTIPGGLGGKEAVVKLRAVAPDAKVIVSSGYSDETVMADFKDYGFDAVLPKPYKYEDLAETLARLLKK